MIPTATFACRIRRPTLLLYCDYINRTGFSNVGGSSPPSHSDGSPYLPVCVSSREAFFSMGWM